MALNCLTNFCGTEAKSQAHLVEVGAVKCFKDQGINLLLHEALRHSPPGQNLTLGAHELFGLFGCHFLALGGGFRF